MAIHQVLKQLSHSSINLLHACPRKYELTKLLGRQESMEDSEDLTFGDAVGYGVQQLLLGRSRQSIWFEILLRWKRDIINTTEKEDRKKKTLWFAYNALEIFERNHLRQLLNEYDVAVFDGVAAAELGFRINIGSGFSYRGFVDIVLIHKKTRKLRVLELKTTAAKDVSPVKFQNSGQGLGYSIVCDLIAKKTPDIDGSEFEILYLVFMTFAMEYKPLPFHKSHSQRALWIKHLLIEVDAIQMYEREDCFPMHGESCESWGRPCEFLNVCNLSNEYAVHGANPKIEDKKYTFEIPLIELISAQMERTQQEILQP